MAHGAFDGGDKLVGPFLAGSAFVILHHLLQIVDDAVVGTEVVGGGVYLLHRNLHVFERTIEYFLHRILWNLGDGCLQTETVLFEQSLYLPENHLILVFAERHDASLVYAETVVGDNLLEVYLVHLAQSLAVGAGTLGRVEGEHVGGGILVGDARDGVHQSLGEVFHLLASFLDDRHHAVALFHGVGHALADALFVGLLHHEFVYHHLDVVVLVAVYLHSRHNLQYLSVHPHIEIALAAHAVEEFAVVALALANERGEEIDGLALVFVENHVDDLLLGVFHHRLAAAVAVGCAGAGVEKAQVVVYLGGGAHSGTGVLVGGLLFDTDDGAESRNLVYVRAFHIAQKVAGVGGEGLDIAALTFGKDGVESQRTLARA